MKIPKNVAAPAATKGNSRRRGTLAGAVGLALLATVVLGATPAAAASIPPGSVTAVPGQSEVSTKASKSASSICPTGQRVLGGGALTVGGVHAVITEMQPIHTAGGDSFKVTAAADQFGIPGAWGFQTYAFCAPVPASLGVEIVSHTNPPTSAGTDQALAQCPGGKFLIGAGGKIDNGNGQVDLGIFTGGSGPFVFSSSAFAKEDLDGFAGKYTVTGYSVCAQGAFGDIQQFKSTTATTSPSQTTNTACPSGLRLTGFAGGTATPGVHLQGLTPNQTKAPSFGTFVAQSSVPPVGSWQLESTVFCAK